METTLLNEECLKIFDLCELKNEKNPIIFSIARDDKSFKSAISICSRISLYYPKIKQIVFAKGSTDSNLFIRLPINLLVREINNDSYAFLLDSIKKLQPRAIVLIDPTGWPELFLESKRLKLNVFWINAKKRKNYNPFNILLQIANLFVSLYGSSYNNVSVYPCDKDTKSLLLKFNNGYKISKNIGRFRDEPVTLPNNEGSKIENKLCTTNRVNWFAAGVYHDELDEILKCQTSLLEWIPNIYLFLLIKSEWSDEYLSKMTRAGLSDKNITLVNWNKPEIIEVLRASNMTILGGSLNKNIEAKEVFDPIIPISYSSAVVTGPNYGHHSELISQLILANGIKTIHQSSVESRVLHKDLMKAIFENLKSNVIADTISNAWLMTTNESKISDAFIQDLSNIIDE